MSDGMGVGGYPAHSITSDFNIDQIVSMDSSDFRAWIATQKSQKCTESLAIVLGMVEKKVTEFKIKKMDLENALEEQGAKKEGNGKEAQVASGEDSPTKLEVGENIRTLMQKVRQGEIDGIQLAHKNITLAEAKGLATAMEEIARARKSTVKTIELFGNKIGDDGVEAFSKVIANENSVVEELYLGACGMTCAGARVLAKALVESKTVRKLCIDGNRLKTEGIRELANAVGSNSFITRLNADLCGLDCLGATRLAEALITNSSLTVISLDHNKDIGTGATKIAQALKKNKSLRHVRLAACNINDDTMEELALALEENKESALEEIGLSLNNITDAGAKRLVQALKESNNQTLQRINLSSNNVSCSPDERIRI